MTAVDLSDETIKKLARSIVLMQRIDATGTDRKSVPSTSAPWIHDTCDECGWDGDAAVIRDPDEGLIGWFCPDCSYFVVMRDLRDES